MLQTDTAHHRVVDASLIRAELGYRDVVDPIEGLRRTVRWQIEHIPGDSAWIDERVQDPYDYAAEDRLVELQKRLPGRRRRGDVHLGAGLDLGLLRLPPQPRPAPAAASAA